MPARRSKIPIALMYALLTLWGMVFGALLFAYVAAGDIYDYQDSVSANELPEVDAIVCLAGARGRITAAGDLWYKYREKGVKPPILYISGMGHQANWNVLARQLKPSVREVIHPEDVVLETESENTDENARWLARYVKRFGWKKVLLTTSPYHMKRAQFIFDRVLEADGAPLEDLETLSVHQEPFEPQEWRTGFQGVRVTVIEYLKWIYYRVFWRP